MKIVKMGGSRDRKTVVLKEDDASAWTLEVTCGEERQNAKGGNDPIPEGGSLFAVGATS